MRRAKDLIGLIEDGEAPAGHRDELIQFFKENPNPDDTKLHALADKLGVSPHDLETEVYALLTSLLQNQ